MDSGMLYAGNYELKRCIGRGSFGEVWLAFNRLAKVEEALKIYNSLDENGLEEFRSEYQVARNLQHPNLLHINHFGVSEGCPYLVMPYCSNGTAAKLIGNATEEQLWHFVHDVVSGLLYLHDQHPMVIHQDIKPSNILISDDDHFVITDFGISRKMTNTLRASSSRAFPTSGTMAYMAPELFKSPPLLVAASDMWAVGISLFEIITGDVPWHGLGGCAMIEGANIPPLPENMSQDMKELIMKCLSFEPWKRPIEKNAIALANDKINGIKHSSAAIMPKRENVMVQPAIHPNHHHHDIERSLPYQHHAHHHKLVKPQKKYQGHLLIHKFDKHKRHALLGVVVMLAIILSCYGIKHLYQHSLRVVPVEITENLSSTETDSICRYKDIAATPDAPKRETAPRKHSVKKVSQVNEAYDTPATPTLSGIKKREVAPTQEKADSKTTSTANHNATNAYSPSYYYDPYDMSDAMPDRYGYNSVSDLSRSNNARYFPAKYHLPPPHVKRNSSFSFSFFFGTHRPRMESRPEGSSRRHH